MSRKRNAVAAGHPLVADTVAEILAAGGNAFDGAVAAIAMTSVVEPVFASLGGGGFLVAAPQGEPTRVFDFFVQTPRKRPQTAVEFLPVDVHFGVETQAFHVGWGTAAVPGAVAGMFDVHRELGRMPIRDLLAPAARCAREGVEVNRSQAHFLTLVESVFLNTPDGRARYGSRKEAGRVAREGETIRLRALGDVLDTLSAEGPDLFYRGEIAASLLDAAGDAGALDAEDLADYRVELRTPLTVDFEGVRVETNAPPASGGALVAFGLKVLEGSSLDQCPPTEDPAVGLICQTLRATSEARATAVLEGELQPEGDVVVAMLAPDVLDAWRRVLPLAPARRGTTHVSIADAGGNLAALTVSNGSGSGRLVPGTDVWLNNMLGEEDLNHRGFHMWPTARRLTSMMAPTVLRWPDGRRAVTGSGGSNRIRSAILQVLVNLVARDMEAEEAVAAPRLHVEGNRLSVEAGFDLDAIAGTLANWPERTLWDRKDMFFGGAHTVVIGPDRVEAVGDLRRGGVGRIL